MTKVGDLKAYHDGASYSVAELYDEKFPSTISVDSDTLVAVHFDPQNGIIDECGNTWEVYDSDNTVIPPVITTKGAKFDFALELQPRQSLICNNRFTILYSQGGTFGGWFYTPIFEFQSSPRKGRVAFGGLIRMTSSSMSYSFLAQYQWMGSQYATSADYTMYCQVLSGLNGSKTGKIGYTALKNIFDEPVHWLCTQGSGVRGGLTLKINDGAFSCGASQTVDHKSNFLIDKICIQAPANGNGVYVSEFKLSRRIEPYSSFSEPIIKKTSHIAFKSASGTLYAPLSSDATYKTPPCLNVRHNGKNYFAIK